MTETEQYGKEQLIEMIIEYRGVNSDHPDYEEVKKTYNAMDIPALKTLWVKRDYLLFPYEQAGKDVTLIGGQAQQERAREDSLESIRLKMEEMKRKKEGN